VDGAAGVVGVCEGQAEGWEVLQTSLAYSSWNVRLCVGLYQRGRLEPGFSFSHLNLAARCLAHSLATREDGFADWCGRMLLENFVSGSGLYDRWMRPFEPFVVRLFARWKNLPISHVEVSSPPPGVYQELLDAWNSEQSFADAVVKSCEYHSEHSIDGHVAHAEFVRVPHNVFPAEILAMKRVRDEAGLPWPTL